MNRLDAVSMGKIVVIREKLLEAQRKGEKIYRFESGDPSFDIPLVVKNAMEQALRDNKTHYIPNNGIPELREALAEKLQKKNGLTQIKPMHVSITNGAMNALYIVYQSIIELGDEVIVPDPMWTEAVEDARLAGATIVPIELRPENDYIYSAAEIKKKITEKTKVIFLNTPHNPTGAIIPKEELQKILEIAKANDLWLVSDEAYEDVLFDGGVHTSIGSLDPYYEKLISVYSCSKSYAMSGLRVGYFATLHPLFNDRASKLLRCNVNGINSVAQWGTLAAIKEVNDDWFIEMNKEYLKRRDLFLSILKEQKQLTPFSPKGAFYLWCRHNTENNATGLSEKLANLGIGNAPGDCFGSSPESLRSIRFAFSCSTKMIEEGSAALIKALTE